ncbi:MAG: hypothetical protein M0Q92_03580 [Methanoregula sp.]|jgi:hypothetical protein|nr:hypothetical protein [Methanoregula sp.]
MKRGPEPAKGLDAAIPAALRRGRVMRFQSSPEYAGNFLFYGNGLLVMVCLRLAVRLSRATLAEISADYAGAIAGLCTIPCGGPVSRELWLYSRYGALRFFRVGDDGSLEEIDRDGVPFVDGKPVGIMLPAPGDAGSPVPAPVAGVPAGSRAIDAPSHIIGWLKKWNAMKNSGADKAGVTGIVNPEKLPDAGSRGPAASTLPVEPGSTQASGDNGGGPGG